jgi:methionine aminotransferase
LIQSSKLPTAGTTIFTVMSRMAAEHGAINLAQGFPDFDGPTRLIEAVGRPMSSGRNQYAPLAGVPELLEQIAAKIHDLYGRDSDPGREICVTPGATEAIHCAISAVLHPGDEAILLDPAYDSYEPCVRLNGARARRIPLTGPDFRVDWPRLRAAVNERTRLLVINTPHNPTGSVWEDSDIAELQELVDGSRMLLLSDEVYEHITFDDRPHLSLLRYPGLARRSFVVSSFGKTYHVTGWRMGYCVAPGDLMREFLKVHQFISFSANAPLQYALADFMRECPDHHRDLHRFYQDKRDLFCRLLEPSRFRVRPCAGTYFQLADYGAISDEPDTEFAARLTRQHGVAAIPVSVFQEQPTDQRVVRFCFAKNDETLERAAGLLCRL